MAFVAAPNKKTCVSSHGGGQLRSYAATAIVAHK
jgi:hypothetical protein